jgi:8-oxo-dGTP pyrophosphatase MutT (NUDIX family)
MNFKEYFYSKNPILENAEPTKFFGKKGAGILIFCSSTKRFLLGLRGPGVDQPNTWGLFGGASNGLESANATAIREMEEEIGYTGELLLKSLGLYRKGDFSYHNFVGIVPEEFSPSLDWETRAARWFRLKDFPKNLHFGVARLLPILRERLIKEQRRLLKEEVELNLDDAYAVFQQEYLKSTGKAWDIGTFKHKAQKWKFYGDQAGYIALRPQNSGFYKLVATAGNNKSKYKALKEISNLPVWGLVSSDIRDLLLKMGFKQPNMIERTLMKKMIPSSVLGNAEILEYQKDGGLLIEYPNVGQVVKYFVGSQLYWKKLYSMKHLMPSNK